MNGMITGEMTLNAAIYQQEVCDVCLNCRHPRCVSPAHGCDAYRDAVRKSTRAYNRREAREEKRA